MPLFDGLEEFKNVSPALQWAIFIVGVMIAIVAVISVCVSIWLMFKYLEFNKKQNSANMTGNEVARKLLDKNDLKHIKVSTWGSLLFGNSYSHYFKKVRLRRLIQNKSSVTSLAMAAEKTALAVMDKEGDKDMKTRVRLTPLIYFGPLAFIPLVAIGVIIDLLVFNLTGVVTTIFAGLGLVIYLISFILAIKVLKTEKKAQDKAIKMLKAENMATDEEASMMKELFKIYNIQYVNDIVMAFLEMIMRVLNFIASIQNGKASVNND